MNTGSRSLRSPLLVAAAGLASLVVLQVRDPHDEGSYGRCPLLQLRGEPCPACGGLRAIDDLARGHVVAAAGSNLLAVALVVVAAAAWVRWVVRRGRGERDAAWMSVGPRAAVVVVVLVLVFGAAPLVPWGAGLVPV